MALSESGGLCALSGVFENIAESLLLIEGFSYPNGGNKGVVCYSSYCSSSCPASLQSSLPLSLSSTTPPFWWETTIGGSYSSSHTSIPNFGRKFAEVCIVSGSKIELMAALLFVVFAISVAFGAAFCASNTFSSSLGLLSGRGFRG